MTSIETYRQILGHDADDLSDEELRALRETNIKLADILFESWLEHRNKEGPESTETDEKS